MAYYAVFDIEVTDPALYDQYRAGAAATIKAAGGRYLVRGGAVEVLEGNPDPHRVIVLEFPTREALRAWYDGPDYAKSKPIREKSARTRAFFVEGAPS